MTYRDFDEEKKLCRYCGKEFVPYHKNRQFTCGSAECVRAAAREYRQINHSNRKRALRIRTHGIALCRICRMPLVRYQEIGINASCDSAHEACAILDLWNSTLLSEPLTQQQRDWMKNHGYSSEELYHDIVSGNIRNLLVY